ncbi:hypothetical protein E1A91_D11G057100v1 [Gossypium mustelinum]|uniref:Uncharacterized protein n=1 Tax=Gossypium mustelinum TaxID=34275 RepID=A0A5D2SPW5_GOSMU|nr:hypothetical protein E1A91_D11G057100v1 [Gossypium mustelinum]
MSEMGRDLSRRRQSSYFSGCYTMSPSCLPVKEEMEYSRIHECSSSGSEKRRQRWRNLLRSIYGSSKPLSFHYDAVSYSQNFDEGFHHQQSIFQDVRS